MPRKLLPTQFKSIKLLAQKVLSPIVPANSKTFAESNFLFNAKRTKSGDSLPEYYLVYFLLIDLLGFKNIGQFEKISWSVPIDYNGRAYLIEHRKFGIGVFAHDPEKEEKAAQEIVLRIQKAVKVAHPYFDWLAQQEVNKSTINVTNNSRSLFNRYEYFLRLYENKEKEIQEHKNKEKVTGKDITSIFSDLNIYDSYFFQLQTEARWLALAAIDAFFSWTEHVFIHLAILKCKLLTGREVAELAEADWSKKFKIALDLSDKINKEYFDKLINIRRDLRNFIAHGAFGKQGESFSFHSGAGAVPVLMQSNIRGKKYSLSNSLTFEENNAIQTINSFINHLWSGEREPAKEYIQESDLPFILTLAANGTYAKAMNSPKEMEEFIDTLDWQFTNAANMDW